MIRKNKIMAILSAFIFSVILWGSVSLSGDYFVTVVVPVQITNVPENYLADVVSSKEVLLRLKGEGWTLSSVSMGTDLEFKVSADFDSGRVFLNLNRSISDNDWLTSGIQVYDISPDTISARIDKISQKKLRIIPAYKLEFEPGYGLASEAKIIPDSILVYGTRRKLESLEAIPTVEKVFSGLERNSVETIELAQIDGLTYNIRNCTATFDVQKIVDKKFSKIDIEIFNVPEARDLLLFPNNVNITLRGGINVLGKMNNDVIRVLVDYSKVLSDTTGTISPDVKIPGNTTLVNTEPEKLKYIIKKY